MKIIYKIILAILICFSFNSFAATQEILSTHAYNNIAIQNISIKESDTLYHDKIIILKSQLESNTIRKDSFKIPKIGKPIWTITAKDLHVTKEVCLEIDALLCRNYKEIFKPNEAQCYNNCISNGPDFVAYDEKAEILYIDAGTNVSGTAGAPRFLFRVDIRKKQIKYLNTFVGPYKAHLSPNGKYLALEDGWNEISVCNTQTGNVIEIRGKNTDARGLEQRHGLRIISWLNDQELKYEEHELYTASQSIANTKTEKIFNVETFKR